MAGITGCLKNHTTAKGIHLAELSLWVTLRHDSYLQLVSSSKKCAYNYVVYESGIGYVAIP